MTKITEGENFEDCFFDDMINEVEKLMVKYPKDAYDIGWNTALKDCIDKLHCFWGREMPKNGDKLFNDIVKEITNVYIPCPNNDDDKTRNLAVKMCVIRLCNFFNQKDSLGEVINSLPKESVTDPDINHPSYYCDGGIETIDYILAKKMDFLLASVCKYISRAGKKDPATELQDLKKARFYLDRKIKLLEGEKGKR